MNELALVLALLSAATFAISTSVQHQAAEGAPESGMFALLGYLFRRPSWLLGQVLATCAFVLHASALNAGPIAVVQPIVISGIVWAVPARAAIARRWPSVRELRSVLITATGLAVLLVASNPTAGDRASLGLGTLAFAAVGVVLALAANTAAVRLDLDRGRKAFLLGVVAGILFGLVAGCVKLALQALDDGGLAGLLTAWPTYALFLFGAGGVLTNQRAYRTAGLSASMPVLNIVNGMTSLAFGFTVFSEVPRHAPVFLALELAALVAMAVGLWMLVQLEEAHHSTASEAAALDRG